MSDAHDPELHLKPWSEITTALGARMTELLPSPDCPMADLCEAARTGDWSAFDANSHCGSCPFCLRFRRRPPAPPTQLPGLVFDVLTSSPNPVPAWRVTYDKPAKRGDHIPVTAKHAG